MKNFTIYRYPVKLTAAMLRGSESAYIKMPIGSMLLSSKITLWRPNEIQLWYMVPEDQRELKEIEIMILGTGNAKLSQDIIDRLHHVNTIVCEKTQEVYHVFIVYESLNLKMWEETC